MIRRQVVEIDNEYILLGSMIMNKDVINSAYRRYKSRELKTKHFTREFQTVFRWLISYYAKHEKPPQSTIQKIFNRRSKRLNRESREIIEQYLETLSEEYYEFAEDSTDPIYVQKEVLPDFIREREIANRLEKARGQLDKGDYDRAEEIISSYAKVTEVDEDETLGTIIPLTRDDVDAGNEKENSLDEAYRFDGDINSLAGPLYKTWLVAITAVEKVGKSYTMQEVGYQAALYQGKKVLVINLELSAAIQRQRIWKRISGTCDKRLKGVNVFPVLDCQNNQQHTCKRKINGRPKENKRPMFRNATDVVSYNSNRFKKWEICQKCRDREDIAINTAKTKRFLPALWFDKKKLRNVTPLRVKKALQENRFLHLSNLRVKCFPRFSVTFDETRDYILRYIDKNDWYPDIVIYDYLDILAPEPGVSQERIDIDRKWKKASQLAGQLNCLVMTADQAVKAARAQYKLDQMSTSESKTKDSHLDARYAINQIPDERPLGISRFGVLFHRHSPFNPNDEVILTQRLHTSEPMLDNARLFGPTKKLRVTKDILLK